MIFMIGCAAIQKAEPLIRLSTGNKRQCEKHLILRATNHEGAVVEECNFYMAKGEAEQVINNQVKYEYTEPNNGGSGEVKTIYPGTKIVLKFVTVGDREKIFVDYSHLHLNTPTHDKGNPLPQYSIVEVNTNIILYVGTWTLLEKTDHWTLEYFYEPMR